MVCAQQQLVQLQPSAATTIDTVPASNTPISQYHCHPKLQVHHPQHPLRYPLHIIALSGWSS